jgi:hypothetical protein
MKEIKKEWDKNGKTKRMKERKRNNETKREREE